MGRRILLALFFAWALWSCFDPQAASVIDASASWLRRLCPDVSEWLGSESDGESTAALEVDQRAVGEHFQRLRERAGRDAERHGWTLRTTWVLTRDEAAGTFLIPLGSDDGVRPDVPVVVGDVLLGFVSQVTEHVSEVLPLAHPGVAVRGELVLENGGSCEIIVGGRGLREGTVEARFPSDDTVPILGTAVVTGAPNAARAAPAGLRLGMLTAAREGAVWRRATRFALRPTLDPRSVDVVALPVEAESGSGLTEVQRREAAIIGHGDVAAGRRSFTIAGGRLDGERIGLAVASGPALLGIVAECGGPAATVRSLTDPGFRVRVVVIGEPDPRGRILESLGRRGGHWRARLIGDRPADVGPLLLATSGFRSGVPRGLVVGRFVADEPAGVVGRLEPAARVQARASVDVLRAEALPERFRARYR